MRIARRPRVLKATGLALALVSALFLTILPGLHDHRSSRGCHEGHHDPALQDAPGTDHTACSGCSVEHGHAGPPRTDPAVDALLGSPGDTHACLACQFLLRTPSHGVIATDCPETTPARDAPSSVPQAPCGPPRIHHRLPRGPPAA